MRNRFLKIVILQLRKAFCCQFQFGMPVLLCLSSYSGSGWKQKFGETCRVLTMAMLLKVSSMMLLTTNINLLIIILGWQQNMSRYCDCCRLKQNINQCSARQIVTWFQITWQSSYWTRDSKNILTSTFKLKLPNCSLYELHGENVDRSK